MKNIPIIASKSENSFALQRKSSIQLHLDSENSKYSSTPVSTDSVSAVYRGPKKKEINEIYGSYVSKRAPSENGP
jgi:hypothetical protein